MADEYYGEVDIEQKLVLGDGARMTLLGGVDARRTYSELTACNGNLNDPVFTGVIRSPTYGRPFPDCSDPRFVFFDPSETVQEQVGVFGQAELWLWNRLQILGGARWTQIDQTRELVATGAKTGQTDEAVTPRLGMLFKITPETSVYASYSESFEQAVGRKADGGAFEPTRGIQYEAGVKRELFGGALLATASAFTITQENLPVADPANPGFQIQVGEVESTGVELDLSGEVLPGLSLIGGIAFIDTEIVGGPNDGKRLGNTYRTKASLWANYEIWNDRRGRWTVGGGAFYHGDAYINNDNSKQIPAQTLFDAASSYTMPTQYGQLTAQLNVKNIFDARDYTGGFGSGNGAHVFLEPGRIILARVIAQF